MGVTITVSSLIKYASHVLLICWISNWCSNVIFANDIQLIPVRKIITFTTVTESCFQACYVRHKCPMGCINIKRKATNLYVICNNQSLKGAVVVIL